MGFSTYLANALLDHVLKNTSYTSPATVYVSLHTADPGNTGTSEVSATGYARQATAFNTAATKATDNSSSEAWTISAGGPVTVTHWGIWDTVSGGNFLFGGSLSSSKTMNNGDSLTAAAGVLDISLT